MSDEVAPEPKLQLPPSATHYGLNLIALGSLLVTLFLLRRFPLPGLQDDVLALVGAVAVPVILLDVLVLRVHRRASTGLDLDKPFTPDVARVATKLLGLAFTLALIALAYWAFPEYHGAFYDAYYAGLRRFAIPFIVAAPFYVARVDGAMREPFDAYWQLGRVLLGHPSDARKADIANHFRGWLVKAFFIPLMVVWLHNETRNLVHFDLTRAAWPNLRLYDFFYSLIFGVDLIFTTAGYALSFRVIDTHIRSAEPTMFGWTVALFCYQPFYGLMEPQFVRYSGVGFGDWLSPWPVARWVWAGMILLLITIYSLATVAFGIRFSNLTHRGILTNGPYRFTKHPAYVSKNLSWWLISVPFIPHTDIFETIRHCLLLGCVNMVYFLRARTEERHLSWDPTYVAYALWMNEHGALRFLNRLIPALKYKPLPASMRPPSGYLPPEETRPLSESASQP
jgi:protein-S-isoprenylcysteine O-methyltransferase Ste14